MITSLVKKLCKAFTVGVTGILLVSSLIAVDAKAAPQQCYAPSCIYTCVQESILDTHDVDYESLQRGPHDPDWEEAQKSPHDPDCEEAQRGPHDVDWEETQRGPHDVDWE